MKKRNGFSLIEVIAAIAMMGIAMSLVPAIATQMANTEIMQQRQMVALQLCQNTMETLLLEGGSDSDLTSGIHQKNINSSGVSCNVGDPDCYYQSQWNVQWDNPRAKVMRLDVTVYYQTSFSKSAVQLLTFRGM